MNTYKQTYTMLDEAEGLIENSLYDILFYNKDKYSQDIVRKAEEFDLSELINLMNSIHEQHLEG